MTRSQRNGESSGTDHQGKMDETHDRTYHLLKLTSALNGYLFHFAAIYTELT